MDTFEEETVLTGPLLGLTLPSKTDKLTCFRTQKYNTTESIFKQPTIRDCIIVLQYCNTINK